MVEIEMQSDAELVEAVLGGDRALFAVLVRRYERAVLGAALAVLRDFQAAEDTAQETFVAAYQKLGSLRDGSRFAAWVLRIARHRAIKTLRRRPKVQSSPTPLDEIPAETRGQLDDGMGELLQAIGRLPERQRRVVLHRYCDGLGVREIAEATGSPIGTVTKDLSRAYARLRQSLREVHE
jgi:RNA polymerase sigma-70 factor, ECF subfamily